MKNMSKFVKQIKYYMKNKQEGRKFIQTFFNFISIKVAHKSDLCYYIKDFKENRRTRCLLEMLFQRFKESIIGLKLKI